MSTWENPKYLNLKTYSKEAQEWGINYTLWDEVIWDTLITSWMNKWKWVWEWLLKKSWFEESEIKDYNKWKLKSEKAKKPNEKEALREMEKANEMIYKEYKEWFSRYFKWENIDNIFPNMSYEAKIRIQNIYKKEGNLQPKKEEKI
jgi:hypothetical protein